MDVCGCRYNEIGDLGDRIRWLWRSAIGGAGGRASDNTQ